MLIGLGAAEMPLWPKYEWLTTAFESLGHSVFRAKNPTELQEAVRTCDVVFLGHRSHAGRWVNIKDVIAQRQCPVVWWWFDLISTCPGVSLFDQPLFASHEALFRGVDLVLTPERNLVSAFQDLGIHAEYAPESCPDGLCEPVSAVKTLDVLLWGSLHGYHQRMGDARFLTESGRSVGWGNAPGNTGIAKPLPLVPWAKIPEVAGSARCVLSCGLRNDLDGYFSDSFMLALASGRPVLRRRTPGLPEGPYFTYDSHDELLDLVDWCAAFPEEADSVGEMGREWVLTEHSTKIRAEQVLQQVAISVGEQGGFGASRMALSTQ